MLRAVRNMKPIVYLATDHAGFELKNTIRDHVISLDYEVIDFGAMTYNPEDDYPDYIRQAAVAVSEQPRNRAIILGGSGQGEAMVANKYRGVRTTVYYGGPEEIMTLSRQHNDANILSIGARFVDTDTVLPLITRWLREPFSQDERHVRRLDAFANIGNES